MRHARWEMQRGIETRKIVVFICVLTNKKPETWWINQHQMVLWDVAIKNCETWWLTIKHGDFTSEYNVIMGKTWHR
jgi:hypothetical protein